MQTRTSLIRAMRTVKKETLKLIETFIEKSEDPQLIASNFVPPLLAAILVDYKQNIPDARDPEVLSVMAVIVNKLKVVEMFLIIVDCNGEGNSSSIG